MSLKERQALPETVSHTMYTPSKLPLKTLKALDVHTGDEVQAPYFFDEDGALCVSLEESEFVGDYYGEFNDDSPYIIHNIEKWAQDQGGYWEWVHPGAIMFVK